MKPSQEMFSAWRAQVEKELAGAPFERLVHKTAEGLDVQPLYTEATALASLPAPRGRFGVCMRVDAPAHRRDGALGEDVDGGADALWMNAGDDEALTQALSHGLGVVIEAGATSPGAALAWITEHLLTPGASAKRLILACDPISEAARGADLAAGLDALGSAAAIAAERSPGLPVARISSVPFHDAGADAADELALLLSSGVATLRALLDAGLPVASAARTITLQVAVGRDTFGELCKLRALRLCWQKLIAAAGAPVAPPPLLHAVCSVRTQAQRDPWVNMLRVTTQVFAAALGGADLVTPRSFDDALGVTSALGRRVARNTALVLREESHLGRVVDPAGGSYYLETRTDQLAREAWDRFRTIERDGGIVALRRSGGLRERLDAAWQKRAAAIARRKEPVLGVSEFANLGEQLPATPPPRPPAPPPPALLAHRDAEAFEALRDVVDLLEHPPVALVTLGPPAEHRARAGYAANFFAAAGLRTVEITAPESAEVACLCGSDERYAAEAVTAAAALRDAGCKRIVLAGKPGALEADLRAAGVTHFIFIGCDVAGTLAEVLP